MINLCCKREVTDKERLFSKRLLLDLQELANKCVFHCCLLFLHKYFNELEYKMQNEMYFYILS